MIREFSLQKINAPLIREFICSNFFSLIHTVAVWVVVMLFNGVPLQAQVEPPEFTRADTLRGTITSERAWWDVVFYDLHTSVHLPDSSVSGYNVIVYEVVKSEHPQMMQIDLREPLTIDSVKVEGKKLAFRRETQTAWYIDTEQIQEADSRHTVTVWYHGKPKIAENPPWDGGFIWEQDSQGNPWIATANQSIGGSVWWPHKDHQSDEPDSMGIHITIPSSIKNISNGRLREVRHHQNGTSTWSWFVNNPINPYNIAINAGKYVSFRDTLQGRKGRLDLSYWVLKPYLSKAKKQFVQVKPMLHCFEKWFGPYPFYEDGYKLIHAPYLGMEHQSAVTYGNGFQNGYRGRDLSGTGWGLTWDFIIVHESGHEWFGNNITTHDVADMWIHEGFTNYSENLFVECRWGKQAGAEYVIGSRRHIENEEPIIGAYGVQDEGPLDIYYKGANLLHTIRTVINDDAQWRNILTSLNRMFYHQIVTSADVERAISAMSGIDFSGVFDQYLRHANLPVLQYAISGDRLYYRWKADVKKLNMPVAVKLHKNFYTRIKPVTKEWREIGYYVHSDTLIIDKNYYIDKEQVKKNNL